MTVREYCNMLIITNGMDIKESVIQSAERYMSDNVLGLSMGDVVETYRVQEIEESDDSLSNLSKTVYMLKNNSKLEAEYKHKCRELIKIKYMVAGRDPRSIINANEVMREITSLHSNAAMLLINNIGSYNSENETLNILGSRFENVRKGSIGFIPAYRGLTFRAGQYRVEIKLDSDTGELGMVTTRDP